jgi:ferredoxin
VRQYSLHGHPADRTGYDVAVLLETGGRGGSAEVHELQEGSPVRDDSRNRPFQVLLPHARVTVEVPADRNMLESLRDALPDTPASCETGLCGSCEVRVLAGRPEHRDDILGGADRERTDIVCPCVSRSRDPLLVLDA